MRFVSGWRFIEAVSVAGRLMTGFTVDGAIDRGSYCCSFASVVFKPFRLGPDGVLL
jgi:hypothetical protein